MPCKPEFLESNGNSMIIHDKGAKTRVQIFSKGISSATSQLTRFSLPDCPETLFSASQLHIA
jgi:hypothetical protein